jgi:glycosyltransferase involved in cell wall biosynthesis
LNPVVWRRLQSVDVAVTFLECEAVLVSRLIDRSVAYVAGAIDLRWARADRSTQRVATSQVVAELCRQHGLRCDGVVTPGVSSALLEGPPAAARPPGPPRLLYVGRLEPNKRVGWLLPLLDGLLPRCPDLTLRLVGDGPMRADLERTVLRRGLSRHVVFVGAQTRAEVEVELRQADVFVFPSGYESFGTAVLEALAVGLPVVATDLPALREATGGHATLLPADDLPAWLDAVGRLLADGALRGAAADAGRAWAVQHTWEHAVDRFEPFVRAAVQS